MNHFHSKDLEAEVLGMFVLEPERLEVFGGFVTPGHFFTTKHRSIYKIMQYMREKKIEMSVTNICDVGTSLGESRDVNAVNIAEVVEHCSGTYRIEETIRRLDEARRAEEAVRAVATQQNVLPCDFLQAFGQIAATAITEPSMWLRARTMGELCKDHFDRVDALCSGEIRPATPTGLEKLDRIIGGIYPQTMIVLAARPGIGKSALSLQIAHAISERDEGVLLMSFEQGLHQIMNRYVAQVGDIELSRIKNGAMKDDDWRRYEDAMKRLRENKRITIRDDIEDHIDAIESAIKTAKLAGPLSLVVVDYLQIIRAKGFTMREQVNDITRRLKQLTQKLNICILLLSQVSRATVNEKVRPPQLSDLKESGSIEQDADVVVFIHRPGKHVLGGDETETHIIVAKQRDGETGFYKCRFEGKHVKFTEDYYDDSEG